MLVLLNDWHAVVNDDKINYIVTSDKSEHKSSIAMDSGYMLLPLEMQYEVYQIIFNQTNKKEN